MFDVAPTELLLVIVVALVVIGPKDLPKAMRFVGKWVGKARGMARHFRAGLDTMMREAELEELEKHCREQKDAIKRHIQRDDTETNPPMNPAT
jgi:sec-independent protein translocase protein TatB